MSRRRPVSMRNRDAQWSAVWKRWVRADTDADRAAACVMATLWSIASGETLPRVMREAIAARRAG